MNTTKSDAALSVEQVDRDAAADLMGFRPNPANYLSSSAPDLVRYENYASRFARHRLAALAPAGGAREATDAEIDAIWKTWNGHDIETAKRSLNYMDRSAARDLAKAMLAAAPPPPTSEPGACAVCGRGEGFHQHAPFGEEWHEFLPSEPAADVDGRARAWKAAEAALFPRHRFDRGDRPRTCEECGYVEHDGSGLGWHPCALTTDAIAAALSTSTAAGEVSERPYPDLLSPDESKELLSRAERLWSGLQKNNLGGFSDDNRPFWIVAEFKTVIEQFGRRDVGLTWSKDDLDAALAKGGDAR